MRFKKQFLETETTKTRTARESGLFFLKEAGLSIEIPFTITAQMREGKTQEDYLRFVDDYYADMEIVIASLHEDFYNNLHTDPCLDADEKKVWVELWEKVRGGRQPGTSGISVREHDLYGRIRAKALRNSRRSYAILRRYFNSMVDLMDDANIVVSNPPPTPEPTNQGRRLELNG